MNLVVEEDPFDAFERSLSNPDAVPLSQVRVRQDRQPRVQHLSNGHNLRVGNDRWSIPPLAEDSNQPVGLQDLDVARFVQRVSEEEITRKHRSSNETLDARAPRPHWNHRQK